MTLEEAREYFCKDRFAMVTTGITIDEIGEKNCTCSFTVDDRHLAVGDHVMGGAIFTLADFSFAVASNTKEQVTLSTNCNISYLGQPKDNRVIAHASCVKDGRRTCLYEIRIEDGLGNPVALVTAAGFHL